jgi:hypothetical protein
MGRGASDCDAERAHRADALGARTSCSSFVGCDCGGKRAAAMYSLVGSAKLNRLDPELYLPTVLARIAVSFPKRGTDPRASSCDN